MTKRIVRQSAMLIVVASLASVPIQGLGQQKQLGPAEAVVSEIEGFGKKMEPPKVKPAPLKTRPKSGRESDKPGVMVPPKEGLAADREKNKGKAVRRDPSANPSYRHE